MRRYPSLMVYKAGLKFEEYAGGTWSGVEDNAAAISFAWDTFNLYLGVKVKDDGGERWSWRSIGACGGRCMRTRAMCRRRQRMRTRGCPGLLP